MGPASFVKKYPSHFKRQALNIVALPRGSMPQPAASTASRARSSPAVSAPSPLSAAADEQAAAEALHKFITKKKGGELLMSAIDHFYRADPKHSAILKDMTPSAFVRKHRERFHYENNVIRPKPASGTTVTQEASATAKAAGGAASGSDDNLGLLIAQALHDFISQRPSKKLAVEDRDEFYLEQPGHGMAIDKIFRGIAPFIKTFPTMFSLVGSDIHILARSDLEPRLVLVAVGAKPPSAAAASAA